MTRRDWPGAILWWTLIGLMDLVLLAALVYGP
jgi:hypothetical protein